MPYISRTVYSTIIIPKAEFVIARKLMGLLDDENGILAVSIGSPPDIGDFSPTPFHSHLRATINPIYNVSLRDSFLREASRHPKYNGIGYKHVAVYDEVCPV